MALYFNMLHTITIFSHENVLTCELMSAITIFFGLNEISFQLRNTT